MRAEAIHTEMGCDPEPGNGFERLNYYFGQQLGVCDFQTEQAYFRERMKLHNRCLHGHGIVSGLRVALPSGDAKAKAVAAPAGAVAAKPDPDRPHFVVTIASGLALDPSGNELYLPHGTWIDLWKLMTPDQQKEWRASAKEKPYSLFLALKYRDVLAAPRRPAAVDPCRLPRDREYGRVRDGVCVVVLGRDPFAIGAAGERCDTCPGEKDEDCVVVLAKIELPRTGELKEPNICLRVRRPVSRYPFNRIVGVNWMHGGVYPADGKNNADALLKVTGLTVRFARKVRVEPLWGGNDEFAAGVVDVLTYSRSVDGPLLSQPLEITPHGDEEFTDSLHIKIHSPPYKDRVRSELRVNHGERVHIVVRGAFLIDACCQPLDGTNVGGAVHYEPPKDGPQGVKVPHRGAKDKPAQPHPPACEIGPGGAGPWAIGASAPGSNFESWFFVNG
jgi:hypothetical protein